MPFGGSFLAEPGDLIFWLDEDGNAVNFAVIISASSSYFRIVISRADGSTASFDVNWANLGTKCTRQGVLVHLIYPSAEQMVYYFCKNELGYSTAAACGVSTMSSAGSAMSTCFSPSSNRSEERRVGKECGS